MAKLQTKWIADDAVNENKVKLSNDGYFRGRNNADNADVNIVKVNTSDQIEFASTPVVGGTALAKVTDIPAVFAVQGNWNANTNSPALVSSTNSTGFDYPLYIVSVSGTTTLDGVSTWDAGDWVYFANGVWNRADNLDDVVSINGFTGVVNLTTTDISEGTNLYFTDARARTAAVDDTVYGVSWDGVTNIAPSKNAVYDKIDALETAIGGAGAIFDSIAYTVLAGDITNGYYDLGQVAKTGSVHLSVKGSPVQALGTDYTLNYTGGVGGNTRITFAGDLSTELVAGDILLISYAY